MEEQKVAIISNVWTNMMFLEKGDIHRGHSHTFDHTHLLSVGKVNVTIDGVETIFEAPTQIFIKRGLVHSLECLSDKSVGTCIHVIRNGSRVEDIVDPRMLPKYSEDKELCSREEFLNPSSFRESKTTKWGNKSKHDNPSL